VRKFWRISARFLYIRNFKPLETEGEEKGMRADTRNTHLFDLHEGEKKKKGKKERRKGEEERKETLDKKIAHVSCGCPNTLIIQPYS